METAAFITAIFYVVFGLLGIILFFKIWGMTNDVKELKEFILNSSHKQNSESIEVQNPESIQNQDPNPTLEQVLESLEKQQKEITVTWNHKFNFGEIVIHKYSRKRLCIALVLDKEKEYRCLNLDTNHMLPAVFDENELLKEK